MGLPDGPEELDDDGLERRRALAAGFQEAAVDVLVGKTLDAARQFEARGILVGGGVSANASASRDDAGRVRPCRCSSLDRRCARTTGAMIAAAACHGVERGLQPSIAVDANPGLFFQA